MVFEDNPALFFYDQIYEVPLGGDVSVTVGVPTGERIAGVDFARYTVSPKTGSSQSYDYYTLILHQVRYPAVIRLTTAPAQSTLYLPGEGTGEAITVQEEGPHLRHNTLPYRGQFTRPGWLPIGWNTAPDGSGVHVGFGSRADRQGADLTLYPQFLPCTAEEAFSYELSEEGAVITGYDGREGDLVIPQTLGGQAVTAIAAGAFGAVAADTVALPPTLTAVERGAFASLTAGDLYFFDSLTEVGEDSFGPCSVTRETKIHEQRYKEGRDFKNVSQPSFSLEKSSCLLKVPIPAGTPAAGSLRPAAFTADGIELVGKIEHAVAAYGVGLLVLDISSGYRPADIGVLLQDIVDLETDCRVFLFEERVGDRSIPNNPVLVIAFGITGGTAIAAIRPNRNPAGEEPVYLAPGAEVHGRLVIVGLHGICHIREGIVPADAGIEQFRRITQRDILTDVGIAGNVFLAVGIAVQRDKTHRIVISQTRA